MIDVTAAEYDPSDGQTLTHIEWAERHVRRAARVTGVRADSDGWHDMRAAALLALVERATAYSGDPARFRPYAAKFVYFASLTQFQFQRCGGVFRPPCPPHTALVEPLPRAEHEGGALGHPGEDLADDGRRGAGPDPLRELLAAEEPPAALPPLTPALALAAALSVEHPRLPGGAAAAREPGAAALVAERAAWARLLHGQGFSNAKIARCLNTNAATVAVFLGKVPRKQARVRTNRPDWRARKAARGTGRAA